MIIGFDYWQVISHYPDQIGHLMFALRHAPRLSAESDHEIHVISAVGSARIGTIEREVFNVLLDAGFESDHLLDGIHEVVFDDPSQSPELKLAKCLELGIDMFFDDRDDVCRVLNAHGIAAMRVTRRDNSTYDLGAER